ncbi:MAG: hypothetical protein MZU97_05415 [Bacillus subtilis]|nr:hypothetical protein [Bacillus subtilis]
MPEANCFVNNPDIDPEIPFGSRTARKRGAYHGALPRSRAKTVAILGCGPIGLMAVDVAKALGAKLVIAIEVNDYRGQCLRKKLARIMSSIPPNKTPSKKC